MDRTQLREDPGIRFGVAHLVVIGLLLLAGAFRLGQTATEVLLVAGAGAYCAGLPGWLRPVMGVITWAFVTGFAVNAYGELTFEPADDVRLVCFVLGVTLVAGLRAGRLDP